MKTLLSVLILCSFAVYFGCAGKRTGTVPPTDNTSVSEVVMAVVSGVVNATAPTGTNASWSPKKSSFFADLKNILNPINTAEAQATPSLGVCPTFQTGGTSCAVVANVETLPYINCNFTGTTGAVWNGSQSLSLTAASTTMTCGNFPTFSSGDSLVRTFGSPTYREILGSQFVALVDTSKTVIGWKTPTAATGETIAFTGPVARNITLNGIHVSGDLFSYVVWDYMITSPSFAVSATNVVASAVVTAQDNKNLDVVTSTLTGLTYTAGCCFPTAGSVTSVYSISGKSETLAFTATCGAATLNGANISLNHCY